MDSIYANFLEAAELRYHTQQTSRIEFLTAAARYQELGLNINRAESDYHSALRNLNQYLQIPSEFDVAGEGYGLEVQPETGVPDSVTGSPMLDIYARRSEVARAEWKADRADYLPDLGIGYTLQSVDGQSGFHSWEIGISFPLLFFSHSAVTRASQLDYRIADQQYRLRELEIHALWNDLVNRYHTLREVLKFYREEALPLADEQIQAANLGYNLGSLDYIQFTQNLESAIRTKLEYLARRADFYEVVTEMNYITGK